MLALVKFGCLAGTAAFDLILERLAMDHSLPPGCVWISARAALIFKMYHRKGGYAELEQRIFQNANGDLVELLDAKDQLEAEVVNASLKELATLFLHGCWWVISCDCEICKARMVQGGFYAEQIEA